MKIIYDVISQANIHSLVIQVQVAITNGYKPIGGVSAVTDGRSILFMQAMIKEDK